MGTVSAENGDERPGLLFRLGERGVVQFTDPTGQTYLFLRLEVTEEEGGATYCLPYYRSSGARTGFRGMWFPCYGVESNGHILKGTPVGVARFFRADQMLPEESFLVRISSEIGLRGMAALNVMTVDQFAAFRATVMRDTPSADLRMEVGDLLERLEGTFLADNTELKAEVAAGVRIPTPLPSVESLQAFVGGSGMGGGGRRRRPIKRKK